MNETSTKEQRIHNIITWNDEDEKFYEDFFSEFITNKFKEIRKFAKNIEGNIDAKMKAIKEKFSEQF